MTVAVKRTRTILNGVNNERVVETQDQNYVQRNTFAVPLDRAQRTLKSGGQLQDRSLGVILLHVKRLGVGSEWPGTFTPRDCAS